MIQNTKNLLGREYQEVVVELETLGFENIEVKELAMSKLGIGEKENNVAKITIDNQTKIEKDSWF